MYVWRLYALLLLSFGNLTICEAGVVSAGQHLARCRITKLTTALNALLVVWGVLVLILLSRYSDDVYLRPVQQHKHHAPGRADVRSVEKSLNQFMLAIFTFLASDACVC
ncbi:hypothetical protein PF008_g28717 [Phytophthora fragariae]|uniref:Amino acid transporter transmembrane domain-containing protein n=1 Tax=Phytophthora fragariae TaxID=53985 RepID=A0A6G0QAI3_9STRA|nr:hypothetical protein PF008_g28717 [Phytophthora fragariae]